MLVWDSIITIINLILIGLYIIVMILATRALLKYIRSKIQVGTHPWFRNLWAKS